MSRIMPYNTLEYTIDAPGILHTPIVLGVPSTFRTASAESIAVLATERTAARIYWEYEQYRRLKYCEYWEYDQNHLRSRGVRLLGVHYQYTTSTPTVHQQYTNSTPTVHQ